MGETIGRQVRLPLGTAFQIALQGIRIRLGRALVTLSGVVLGLAFLMNVVTGDMITRLVANKQQLKEKVNLMYSLLDQEVGDPHGRVIGVVVYGTLTPHEQQFLTKVLKAGPKQLRGVNVSLPGVTTATPETVGAQADALVVLGNAKEAGDALSVLTTGLNQPLVLDTEGDRVYPNPVDSDVKPVAIFGDEATAEKERLDKVKQDHFRSIWIVTISLLVTVIGIANALLMSVTERFKEIGTMKCLGALSGFIRQLFLIESAMIGVVGSVIGIIIGIIFPMVAYSFAYGWDSVFGAMNYLQLIVSSLICLGAGTVLSIVAAIYPATIAARMIPAMALRSNV